MPQAAPIRIDLPQHWTTSFLPLDRQPIHAWAEQNVVLGNNYTITGPFHLRHSLYLRALFESIHDDRKRIICLRKPVRSGGTLLSDIFVQWLVVNDPGPCMWNFPTDSMAKDHAKTRAWPDFRQCAPLAALLPENRHDRNVQEIHFANGMPLFIQGPSVAHLQAKGIRYLINDDIHCWPPGRILQAYARTKDFDKMGNSKTLNISQAGVEDDDEDAEWTKGDQQEWHVRCLNPDCRHQFAPVMEYNRLDQAGQKYGFIFDDSETMLDGHGDWRVPEAAATITFRCPQCGHLHRDEHATRQAWNESGEYIPQNLKAAEHRASFHYEASVVRSWRASLEEYLYALNALRRGVMDQIKAWHQKERAVPWSEMILFKARPNRTYNVLEEWKEEEIRFFTLDAQDEGVYWGMICAWSRKGECRRLWRGRLTSEAEILKLQTEFKVRPSHVGVDCGFETKRIYAMCARNNWIAFRGDSRPEFTAREKRGDGLYVTVRRSWEWYQGDPEIGGTGRRGHQYAFVVRWSNPTIKDRLSQLLSRGLFVVPKTDPGDEMELEYNRQMSAEYKKQKRNPITGQIQMIWVCPSGRNHYFDCASEQVMFATLKRFLPDLEPEPVPVDSA